MTCTAAYGNTRSLTHWVRPGIKPKSSWMLVGFFFFFLFRATCVAYGSPQARGLQLLAYATAPARQDPSSIYYLYHGSQQCQTPNPLSEASILLDTSQVCFHWATTRTPTRQVLNLLSHSRNSWVLFSPGSSCILPQNYLCLQWENKKINKNK